MVFPCTLCTSDTRCMFFPHTNPFSNTRTQSTIQFSSDAVYLEIPEIKGSVPQDCPILDVHHKFQAVTCTSGQLAISCGSHNLLLGFDNLLNWLTEFRETVT